MKAARTAPHSEMKDAPHKNRAVGRREISHSPHSEGEVKLDPLDIYQDPGVKRKNGCVLERGRLGRQPWKRRC